MAYLATIQEIKDYLRITSSAIDLQIQALADSAEEWMADHCGTAFKTKTVEEFHDGGNIDIRPRMQPIIKVESVYDCYLGQALDPTLFLLRGGERIKRVYYCPDKRKPWFIPDGVSRIKLTYTCGYNNGDTEPKPEGSIPAPKGLTVPLLMLVRRHYESRGNQIVYTQGTSVNWGTLVDGDIMTLLAPYDLKPAF